MRKVALIQARMNSERLPGKVIMPLAGKPLVLHLVERLRSIKEIDHVVVATAEHPSNDPLVEICDDNKIDCFRGSLDDVLGRLTSAGQLYEADIVIRATCDCPLVERKYVAERIAMVEREDLAFTYCLSSSMLFAGATVMKMTFLDFLNQYANRPEDREHCGLPFALLYRKIFRSKEVFPDEELNSYGYRLTVDERADYEVVKAIYDALYSPGRPIDIKSVLQFLQETPALVARNSMVKQKYMYKDV